MATTTMLETARDRVASRLAEKQGSDVSAFVLELLMFGVEAVLVVLERCLVERSDADVMQGMSEPGLIARLAVRRRVRGLVAETYGPFGFHQHGGAELAEALLAAAREASDSERHSLLQECRNMLKQ